MMSEVNLWKLRQEIKLGSLFVSDYRNSFGIAPHKVCDFFDGFLEFVGEAMHADYPDYDGADFWERFLIMTSRNGCWTGITVLMKTRCRCRKQKRMRRMNK